MLSSLVKSESRTDTIKQIPIGFMLCSKKLNISRFSRQLLFENKNTLSIPTGVNMFSKQLVAMFGHLIFNESYMFLGIVQLSLCLVYLERRFIQSVLRMLKRLYKMLHVHELLFIRYGVFLEIRLSGRIGFFRLVKNASSPPGDANATNASLITHSTNHSLQGTNEP